MGGETRVPCIDRRPGRCATSWPASSSRSWRSRCAAGHAAGAAADSRWQGPARSWGLWWCGGARPRRAFWSPWCARESIGVEPWKKPLDSRALGRSLRTQQRATGGATTATATTCNGPAALDLEMSAATFSSRAASAATANPEPAPFFDCSSQVLGRRPPCSLANCWTARHVQHKCTAQQTSAPHTARRSSAESKPPRVVWPRRRRLSAVQQTCRHTCALHCQLIASCLPAGLPATTRHSQPPGDCMGRPLQASLVPKAASGTKVSFRLSASLPN